MSDISLGEGLSFSYSGDLGPTLGLGIPGLGAMAQYDAIDNSLNVDASLGFYSGGAKVGLDGFQATVVEQFIGAFLVALTLTGFTGLLTRDEPAG